MRVISVVLVLLIANVLAYHDPDLNYHINQLQRLQNNAQSGYNYPVPSVQLTTSGVKVVGNTGQAYSASLYSQPPTYNSNVLYQAPVLQKFVNPPLLTNQIGQPSPLYGPPAVTGSVQQKEAHGYSTSAGLSSYSGVQRTVTPQATYAQAPIIAKITAAPLIAKYAAPDKTTFVNQNVISTHVEDAINPVVSQVYAAPSARYAVANDLRLQNQIATQSANYVAPVTNAPIAQYTSPTLSQYPQTFKQFVPPPPSQLAAPVQQPISVPSHEFSQSGIAQYISSISQGVSNQLSGPVLGQIAPIHFAAINGLSSRHISSPVFVKNVHTDFLENYDAHPRYEYEYHVHDPHTGDIKQQREQRDGEVVKGQYSLVEPDGSVRTVDYVADWKTGFHANVRNSKQNH